MSYTHNNFLSMQELLGILQTIIENETVYNAQINADLVDQICEIYAKDSFRHSYAELSSFLEKLAADQRDEIGAWLSQTLQDENLDGNIENRILKLLDHVELESLRLTRMEQVKAIGESASKKLEDAAKISDETKNTVRKLSKKIKNIFGQIISVLGIFTGIVVTFSVITQISTNVFDALTSAEFFRTLLTLSFLSFFAFNTVFMLMYTISKLTDNGIASSCKHCDCNCSFCKKKCWGLPRLHRKYPYVVWVDGLLLLFIILFLYLSISHPLVPVMVK